jgi:hypothetical protein
MTYASAIERLSQLYGRHPRKIEEALEKTEKLGESIKRSFIGG